MKRSSCPEIYSEVTSKSQKIGENKKEYPVFCYKYSTGDFVNLPAKNLFTSLNNSLKPDGNGIFYENNYVIQMSWKNGVINGEMIVVDKKLHCLIGIYSILNNTVLKTFDGTALEDDILDLSDRGTRWEGKVHNGEACGWGSLYNEHGQLEYTGFRFGTKNVCYGTLYHSDLATPSYDGMLHNNVRYGIGRLLARDGSLIYEGYWLNNVGLKTSMVYKAQSKTHLITPFTEELTFPRETAYLFEDIDLHWLFQLKHLHVEQNCFLFSPTNSLFSLSIQQLSALQSIRIESNSFHKIHTATISSLDRSLFSFFLELPSLEELYVGASCFLECEQLTLNGTLHLPLAP